MASTTIKSDYQYCKGKNGKANEVVATAIDYERYDATVNYLLTQVDVEDNIHGMFSQNDDGITNRGYWSDFSTYDEIPNLLDKSYMEYDSRNIVEPSKELKENL